MSTFIPLTVHDVHWGPTLDYALHHLDVVAGKWRAADFAASRPYEVEGQRLGIVGLDDIGKKVARRVQGFGHALLRRGPAHRGPEGRAPRALRAVPGAPPHLGRGDAARAA